MMLDPAIAASQRTEVARQLIAQAQVEAVELVTVSALELCVLGGPKHPMFEDSVAQAWLRLGERRRRKMIDEVTAGMVDRGLLAREPPERGTRPGDSAYSLNPQLGIMLAARCRPSAIVMTDIGSQELRTPRCFVLGDQAEPVRGVVFEEPAMLPAGVAGSFPHVKKLGPLGWFYRYLLVSDAAAARVLAALTISPPRRSGVVVAPGWTVAAFYPGRGTEAGKHLGITGDGVKAHVDGPGPPGGDHTGTDCDAGQLAALMLQLIAGTTR